MSEEKVVLVDHAGHEIGIENKLAAHRFGKLHRAFSVFIFYNTGNEIQLLLQQRHPDKYHSGGLWTNTCCSHPRPHENVIAAGERRLKEEMGIIAKLSCAGEFHYTAEVSNDLIENEYDYVLVGWTTSTEIHFNPKEVAAIRWINFFELEKELQKKPNQFSPWFESAFRIASLHSL